MFLPAHKQRQMIVDREVSSVEMTEASLRRIADLEPQLHAFITLDEEGARAAAKEADAKLAAGTKPGVLQGVPIAVKDLEVTKNLRTTLGSSLFEDWVPNYDSVAVERLRNTGAVILGKTNTPEFGNIGKFATSKRSGAYWNGTTRSLCRFEVKTRNRSFFFSFLQF